MQKPRSTAVTAAVAFAAALAASGITYASAASEQVAQTPAPRLAVPPQAPMGGDVPPDPNSKGNEGRANVNNEGRHHEHEHEHEEEGRIRINERTYSSRPGDCITVLLLGGANSLNISNDSRKTVEVFSGPVCDMGTPIAMVGPRDTAFGVVPLPVGNNVASFRVIDHDRDCDHDHDHEGNHEGNHEGDRDHR
ncbi:hypothetical protein RKE30_38605 [Streptomyces sp. Li-HN-5-11]|uniref:hypothetical protein n=1 Tax=Streptomyces sp. Li-HN-5-11 TaxID=3075432 RepID=UPI0028A5C4F1|nr:hypothetical protein [Streptomyces sp. Li-HN-5-11]WNM35849.1 hypothetical protein RKE30_38605 [Streptomyces sp. Li-HN-5-11]